jgi:hypothetical protein
MPKNKIKGGFKAMKKLIIMICLLFIIGCDMPVDMEANIKPDVDWDSMCYDCHDSGDMSVNCTPECLNCHELTKHPGYIFVR